MKCPNCNKEIYGMTGWQEIQKFQKHLLKCRKNPNRIVCKDKDTGNTTTITYGIGLDDALRLRAESGQ